MGRRGAGRRRIMVNLKRKRAVGKRMGGGPASYSKKSKTLSPASIISRRNRSSGMVAQHPTGAKM